MTDIPPPDDPNPYQQHVRGSFGSVPSEYGTVSYVQTKARLGVGGDTDPECVLSGLLSPTRELLKLGELSFNQLLQRDLDDARVAERLVPYLFGDVPDAPPGPSFFPPVIAVLLPFLDRIPQQQFITEAAVTVDGDSELTQGGEAFRIKHHLPTGHATVDWRDAQAKLVVIDGQHRAMALLAVHRTMHNEWADSPYRMFYEPVVGRLLKKYGTENVAKMQLPVTLCWFSGVDDHQKAARKLFVDLNQNAKPVSEARVLLLGESDFVARAVRELLDRVKENADLELASVEYDSPSSDLDGPQRWSAVTNITILNHAVRLCLTASAGKFTDLERRPFARGPRPGTEARNLVLRQRLFLGLQYTAEFERDGIPVKRDTLGQYHVPRIVEAEMAERFWTIWGDAICRLLFESRVPKAHITALRSLGDSWTSSGAADGLARAAIFEGSGTYWSLQERGDSEELEELKELKRATGEILAGRRKQFEELRAEAAGTSIDDARELFERWTLVASQLGLVLTYGSIFVKCQEAEPVESPESLKDLVDTVLNEFCSGLDAALAAMPHALARAKIPGRMDANSARFFRAHCIELLNTPPARAELGEGPVAMALMALLPKARRVVITSWTVEREKALEEANPDQPEGERREQAKRDAIKGYLDDLDSVFGYPTDEVEEIRLSLANLEEEVETAEEADETAEEYDVLEPDEG